VVTTFAAMPLLRHQSRIKQDAKMLGDRRATHLEVTCYGVDSPVFRCQQVKHLSSCWMTDRREDIRFVFECNHANSIGKRLLTCQVRREIFKFGCICQQHPLTLRSAARQEPRPPFAHYHKMRLVIPTKVECLCNASNLLIMVPSSPVWSMALGGFCILSRRCRRSTVGSRPAWKLASPPLIPLRFTDLSGGRTTRCSTGVVTRPAG
jgi:hypothetical protein